MSRATPEDALAHFHTLTAAGWSLRAIATHAGIGPTDLSRFVRERGDSPAVIRGVMQVDPSTLPQMTRPAKAGATSEPFVSRVGTVRRLRALQVMGWPAREIGGRAGKPERWVHNKLNQQGRWVRRSTHDLVAKVYREMSHLRGPSEKTRTIALGRGYAGPADWEDIDLDEAPIKSTELCQADGCLNLARGTTDPRVTGPTGAYCQPHRDLALDGAA